MDWHDRLRLTIISTVIRDIPRGFWEDAKTQVRRLYMDAFHQISADPNVLKQQQSDKLYQDRYFRMESLFAALAGKHGLACSPTLLAENNCTYVYVAKGAIGMTQAYVPAIGSTPKPAKFRERLAAMSGIPDVPRLDLGDEPAEVLIGKDFYGIVAHNPVGKRFDEAEQRLGMLQFCVPVKDCSKWAAQLSIEEMLAAYESAAPTKKEERGLEWKRRKDEEGGTG